MNVRSMIVVGVDFEAPGDDAICAALQRAHELPNVAVSFVYAVELANLAEEFGEEEFDSDEEALERAAERLAKRVERVAAASGYAYDPRRMHMRPRAGKPADVLLRTCSEERAELVIVGTHARRGLDRLVLGSVAENIARLAPCPVLVARPVAHGRELQRASRASDALHVHVRER